MTIVHHNIPIFKTSMSREKSNAKFFPLHIRVHLVSSKAFTETNALMKRLISSFNACCSFVYERGKDFFFWIFLQDKSKNKNLRAAALINIMDVLFCLFHNFFLYIFFFILLLCYFFGYYRKVSIHIPFSIHC